MQQEKQEKRQPKKHRWLRFAPQLVLGLGLLAGYFSWRDHRRKLTQQELDTALTRYMQGKYAIYGDTLTPVGEGKVVYAPNDLFFPTTNQYELEFETEKYPKRSEKETVVLRYNYEENTLRDTYMSFVLREQVEEKFREIFDRIYEQNSYDLVIAVQAAPWKEHDYSAVETIDHYLHNTPYSNISICVIRGQEKIEEDMQELLGELIQNEYGVDGIVYYMDEEEYKNRSLKGSWIEHGPYSYTKRVRFARQKEKAEFSIFSLKEGNNIKHTP